MNTEFFVLLDQAGQIPTVIDRCLAAARAKGVSDPDVIAAHNAVAQLGVALQRLERWGVEQIVAPARGVVADVSSVPVGTGPIKLSDMSHGNWSFYQQNNLAPNWAHIFQGTVDELNAAIGALPGNLTTAAQDPVVGLYDLRTFI
jgi:hypothetical protein